MNFIIDAHPPFYWKIRLAEKGHDVIHTIELPKQNQTTDSEIIRLSLSEKRIVITKDADFVDSFLLQHAPYKLVIVRTGNVRLQEMKELFDQQVITLLQALENSSLIELYKEQILIVE